MIVLDWKRHHIGALKPCRLCGAKAFMRDENGEPCHKVCAEHEISEKAAQAAGRGI